MLKRLGLTLAGAAVLLVACALALPWLVPQRFAHDRLDAALRRSGNVRLERAGTIRVSLFPTPGITVDDVKLQPRKALRKLPPISASRIFVAIEPASLLRGKLTATRITIERPEMIFGAGTPQPDEPSARAAASGDVISGTGGPADASPAPGPVAEPDRPRRLKIPTVAVELTDGAIIVQNGGQQRRIAFARGDLQLRGAEGDSVSSITGTINAGGEDVRIDLLIEDYGTQAPAPIPLVLRVDSRALSAIVKGELSPDGGTRFAGDARFDVRSVQPLMMWLGSDSRLLASLEGATFEGLVSMAPDGYALTNAKIGAPGVAGEFEMYGNAHGAKATIKSLTLHSGRGEGRLTLDTTTPEADLRAELTLTGVDGLALAKSVSTFDWVSGTMDMALSISARGDVARLSETLMGEARVSVVNGALEGLDLPQIVADIERGEFRKWKRDPAQRTPFDRFTAVFAIDQGNAATKDLSLTGPNISATGEGSADIARRKLDFRLKAQVTAASGGQSAQPATNGTGAQTPASGQTAALTVPLRVKGDWKKPSIKPDLAEALKDSKSLHGNADLIGKSLENATGGKIKANDVGDAIKSLFGKKQKSE